MPREKITRETPNEDLTVSVAWTRGRDVQLGVQVAEQADGQHSMIDALWGGPAGTEHIGRHLIARLRDRDDLVIQPVDFRTPDEEAVWCQAIGREVLDVVGGSAMDMLGLWWTGTRSQVNELIRKLRKARDGAYGRDE